MEFIWTTVHCCTNLHIHNAVTLIIICSTYAYHWASQIHSALSNYTKCKSNTVNTVTNCEHPFPSNCKISTRHLCKLIKNKNTACIYIFSVREHSANSIKECQNYYRFSHSYIIYIYLFFFKLDRRGGSAPTTKQFVLLHHISEVFLPSFNVRSPPGSPTQQWQSQCHAVTWVEPLLHRQS